MSLTLEQPPLRGVGFPQGEFLSLRRTFQIQAHGLEGTVKSAGLTLSAHIFDPSWRSYNLNLAPSTAVPSLCISSLFLLTLETKIKTKHTCPFPPREDCGESLVLNEEVCC